MPKGTAVHNRGELKSEGWCVICVDCACVLHIGQNGDVVDEGEAEFVLGHDYRWAEGVGGWHCPDCKGGEA